MTINYRGAFTKNNEENSDKGLIGSIKSLMMNVMMKGKEWFVVRKRFYKGLRGKRSEIITNFILIIYCDYKTIILTIIWAGTKT